MLFTFYLQNTEYAFRVQTEKEGREIVGEITSVNAAFLFPQTLLELGASPDYKDSRGLSALYHTAIVGGESDCCELLLHEHASISCQDENGWHEVHQVTFGTA